MRTMEGNHAKFRGKIKQKHQQKPRTVIRITDVSREKNATRGIRIKSRPETGHSQDMEGEALP